MSKIASKNETLGTSLGRRAWIEAERVRIVEAIVDKSGLERLDFEADAHPQIHFIISVLALGSCACDLGKEWRSAVALYEDGEEDGPILCREVALRRMTGATLAELCLLPGVSLPNENPDFESALNAFITFAGLNAYESKQALSAAFHVYGAFFQFAGGVAEGKATNWPHDDFFEALDDLQIELDPWPKDVAREAVASLVARAHALSRGGNLPPFDSDDILEATRQWLASCSVRQFIIDGNGVASEPAPSALAENFGNGSTKRHPIPCDFFDGGQNGKFFGIFTPLAAGQRIGHDKEAFDALQAALGDRGPLSELLGGPVKISPIFFSVL